MGDVPTLDFGLLGPLTVRVRGRPVSVGGPKPRTVLIRLLLEPGVLVSTDALVDAVWEERAPADAVKNVQIYVARMRKVLPNGLLASGANGYFADCPPEAVDALRYDHLIRSARTAMSKMELDTALDHFRAAAGLWSGDVLADVRYATFAQSPIAYYEQLRDAAREDEVGLRLEIGQGSELVPELERMVRDEPLRERRWGQLMVAYYQAGRQSEALRAFERMRATFVEEMGLDPSPEMRALEQRILHHDPALAPSNRQGPVAVAPAPAELVGVTSTSVAGRVDEVIAGESLAVLDAVTRALRHDPRARSAIVPADRRDSEGSAVLEFARDGELVVSQDAQSALIVGGLDPRRLSPAGFVTITDGGSRAVYLCRWRDDGDGAGAGPPAGALRRGVLPSYRNAFVGRRAELAAIDSALMAGGAVTLTGPGGIGKTRLAVEYAASAAGYADGVWLVDTVGLDRPDGFWTKLLDVLAISVRTPTGDTVADALRDRAMLVVIDNCEPIAGTVAELVDALAGVHGVRSIVTSRTRLGSRGERVVGLEPLEWENTGDAAELMVARAAELGIDLDDATLVEQLCAAVAGMPLAIELAVAQLGHLSVGELLARMDDQPRTLAVASRSASSARHGSLQATFESSLDLLTGAARRALLASSVLRGDFDLTAVTAVCGDDPRTVARELVDASLWSSTPAVDRRTRYRQLEPIRQFTYSRLLTSPAAADVHVRHAEYFTDLANRSDGLRRAGDADSVLANLTAAYEWCRAERRDAMAAQIATAMLSLPARIPTIWSRTAPHGELEGRHR